MSARRPPSARRSELFCAPQTRMHRQAGMRPSENDLLLSRSNSEKQKGTDFARSARADLCPWATTRDNALFPPSVPSVLLPSLPLALSFFSLPPSLYLSYRREHKLQQVNLHWKRVWWEEGKAFVKLRLSAKAIKSLKTKVCSVYRERELHAVLVRIGTPCAQYRETASCCGGCCPLNQQSCKEIVLCV